MIDQPAHLQDTGSTRPEALRYRSRVIPYPAIEKHGIIGDHRTAALVAADGTMDWLCLPDFDGPIVFGALLDCFKGGHWRLGPARLELGEQAYLEDSMVLETRWHLEHGSLLLQETMLWPEIDRPPEQANVRAILRTLRCVRGTVGCEMELRAAYNFEAEAAAPAQHSSGFTLQVHDLVLRLWTNYPPVVANGALYRVFELKEGDELWAALELGAAGHGWTMESARAELDTTAQYWRNWVKQLRPSGAGEREIRRTA
jgi:GH15 family glucan-1,4-alpha-glucosidase